MYGPSGSHRRRRCHSHREDVVPRSLPSRQPAAQPRATSAQGPAIYKRPPVETRFFRLGIGSEEFTTRRWVSTTKSGSCVCVIIYGKNVTGAYSNRLASQLRWCRGCTTELPFWDAREPPCAAPKTRGGIQSYRNPFFVSNL